MKFESLRLAISLNHLPVIRRERIGNGHTHYGVVGLPARVRHPDRKGKVERAVGHAQGTPLKGRRFESLEAAQDHLDKWSEQWADTRIHGTTKRQVAAMTKRFTLW